MKLKDVRRQDGAVVLATAAVPEELVGGALRLARRRHHHHHHHPYHHRFHRMVGLPSKTNGARIEFRSPSLHLNVRRYGQRYSTGDHSGWRITEEYDPEGGGIHKGQRYGAYWITLSREIGTEDAGSLYINGCYLARMIDSTWTYSTGLPFGGRAFDLFSDPTNPPHGWHTNEAEVIDRASWFFLQGRTDYTTRFRISDELPLANTLRIAELIAANKNEMLEELLLLHAAGLASTDFDLHIRYFAQAIELVGKMLPGGKRQKDKHVPDEISKLMRQPLDWLFHMSNSRRETRHTLRRAKGAALTERMSDEEKEDYLHDANIVFHYVIARDLLIPLVLNQRGESIVIQLV